MNSKQKLSKRMAFFVFDEMSASEIARFASEIQSNIDIFFPVKDIAFPLV